jgi:hypothetical protein
MLPYFYISKNGWFSLGASVSIGKMNCGHVGLDISIDFLLWHISFGLEK